MDIVKRLNLNKTPKDALNGSIVCAKNMMIDDTGSFLTNDIGFKEVCSFSGENIVGVITCTNEIVILTSANNIYRKFDNKTTLDKVKSNWTYSGGTIRGTYSYNYKNELILSIAESGVHNVDIPLKSFIIKTNTESDASTYPYKAEDNQTYNNEEEIPTYDINYVLTSNGNLVCGVYTFFIRFIIDTDNKTRWFQITTDIIITQEVLSKKYIHRYLNSGGTGLEIPISKSPFTVNSDGVSNKAVVLNLNIGTTGFKQYELGYIIKRKGDVQGRVQGTYNVIDDIVTISDNTYVEEVGISELLENPHQFFNVETIATYNNRLYMSNYKEYDVEDYSNISRQIKIRTDNNAEEGPTNASLAPGYSRLNLELELVQTIGKGNDYYTRFVKKDKIQLYNILANNNIVVTPSTVIDAFKDKLFLLYQEIGVFHFLNGDTLDYKTYKEASSQNINLYWFLQNPEDLNDAVCISSLIKNSTVNLNTDAGWDWDFTIPTFDIKIEDGIVSIVVSDKEYPLNGSNKCNSCILGYYYDSVLQEHNYWFGQGYVVEGGTNMVIAHGFNKGHSMGSGISISLLNSTGTTEGDVVINDDGSNPGGIPVVNTVNTRTLIPKQKYNFFIHYIRKDGSATLGYPIGTATFDVSDYNYSKILVPVFSNIQNPDSSKYIGFFISYEDVERNSDCIFITENANNVEKLTNAEYIYDLDTPRASVLHIGANSYPLNGALLTYIENRLMYNHLRIDDSLNVATEVKAFITKALDNQYNNKAKTLYRLTRNIYSFAEDVSDRDYLPDFYNTQVIIAYKGADGLIIDPSIEYVMKMDNTNTYANSGVRATYSVDFFIIPMYSKYPTEAMNVKQDFTEVALNIMYDDDSDANTLESHVFVNCVISPDKLHDYLELQSCYRAKPSKAYTNFREDNISRFDKTVYRSDVVSDESLVNGFRHFGTDNYKNILENKGKITNIVGIGLYLLVHTEYSLFVFDRSPKLTAKYQMNVPDTFEVDYQEVMPSNEGFGGLIDKDEAIVSKHGYIWFDKANKVIFCYENGAASILSGDIHNFLQYINIDTVRFAEDLIHSRLIICIKLKGTTANYITLSYSFNSKTYISMHDYKFTNNYRTYSKSYIFDNAYPNKLYEFDDESIADYKALAYNNNLYFPTISQKSYVDIIYNLQYEASKALDSITYILNQIEDRIDAIIVSEEDMNRRFSGDVLRIYSDENNTGDLDINTDNNTNKHNNYKYPYWDKGKWNLNYFRNKISDRNIDDTNKNDAHETRPDNLNVIYGKYFVVRFIFNNDKKIKLETVNFNINPY